MKSLGLKRVKLSEHWPLLSNHLYQAATSICLDTVCLIEVPLACIFSEKKVYRSICNPVILRILSLFDILFKCFTQMSLT